MWNNHERVIEIPIFFRFSGFTPNATSVEPVFKKYRLFRFTEKPPHPMILCKNSQHGVLILSQNLISEPQTGLTLWLLVRSYLSYINYYGNKYINKLYFLSIYRNLY